MNIIQAFKKAGPRGFIWRSSNPDFKYPAVQGTLRIPLEDLIEHDWYGDEPGLSEIVSLEEQLNAAKEEAKVWEQRYNASERELNQTTAKMVRYSDRVSELERGIESLYMNAAGLKEVPKKSD